MNDDPFAVQAEVLREDGAWVVYLEFWYPDGIRRHRVGTYPSEAAAGCATRWMVWAARRDARPPDGLEIRDIPR